MNRMPAIDPTNASGRTKELLEQTNAQLGRIPNLYKSMANSPAALDGYLKFRSALGAGVLSAKMKERVALLTAAINQCGYCVSAHTLRGGKVGLSADELIATQRGQSTDPKEHAALHMVTTLLQKRGRFDDEDFQKVKAAGLSDEEIGEIVAHTALNVFSNFFNHVAEPELDFPSVTIER
jgi:uncharacterized peroxidase-related enzyme